MKALPFRSSILLVCLLLGGCAASAIQSGGPAAGSRILSCKSGDTAVASQNQCLQDGAACYSLSNGSWCTGERGNTCPAGSSALPAGAACPTGARCFVLTEGLSCYAG